MPTLPPEQPMPDSTTVIRVERLVPLQALSKPAPSSMTMESLQAVLLFHLGSLSLPMGRALRLS